MKSARIVPGTPHRSKMSAQRLLLAGAILLVATCAMWWTSGSAAAQANSLGVDHDGGAADINAGPAAVAPGASTTISIVTDAPASGLGAWTVNVMYDPAVMTPVG